MNTHTPYRGLLDSSCQPSKADKQKQNFEAFKQKKYKEIDEARGKSQSKELNQSQDPRRRSILKPTSLNLRNLNLAPVEQGPPTFDSEYEFRNLLVSEGVPVTHNHRLEEAEIEYSLSLNSLVKQYETKLKVQAERYELEILRLNGVIEGMREENAKLVSRKPQVQKSVSDEVEYCHLCSNGEVVNRLNKMMKSLEEAHKDCVTNENQASKRIIQLESTTNELRETIDLTLREKNVLVAKTTAFECEIQRLKQEIESKERVRSDSLKPITQSHIYSVTSTFEKDKANSRSIGLALPITHERSGFQSTKPRPSSALLQPPMSKRATSSIFREQLKPKRQGNILDQYQSELSAAQIIDRVKTNSMLGTSTNPRTRILNDKKLNAYP